VLFGAAAAVLVSVLIARSAGLDTGAWRGFAANTQKHAHTPLSNNVGLPTVLAFDESNRAVHIRALWLDTPWDLWREARVRTLGERRWLHVLLIGVFLAALAMACRGRSLWVQLTLSVGLIPFATDLTSYYYAMLFVFAFLWPACPSIGIGLLALSALSTLAALAFSEPDDVFGMISVAVVLFVGLSTAILARSRAVPLDRGRPVPETALPALTVP
jgi:hypothetical protein